MKCRNCGAELASGLPFVENVEPRLYRKNDFAVSADQNLQKE